MDKDKIPKKYIPKRLSLFLTPVFSTLTNLKRYQFFTIHVINLNEDFLKLPCTHKADFHDLSTHQSFSL